MLGNFCGRGEGAEHAFPVEFNLVLEALQLCDGGQHLDNRLLLFVPRQELHKLLFLELFEGVLDGLQGAGLVVLNHLFVVEGFHVPLNGVIELIKGGSFVAVVMISGEGDDVDKAGPVALYFGSDEGNVEGGDPRPDS